MPTTMFQGGKHSGQPLTATGVTGQTHTSRLFFISDRTSGLRLLVDTGAEVSVIPPSRTDRLSHPDALVLQAANDTSISTYGKRSLTLNLGLRRSFQWVFVVAKVKHPILGADFLRHFNLLVDVGHKRLVDAVTNLQVNGVATCESTTNLPQKPTNAFEAIVRQFPLVIQPYNPQQPIKHQVTHHITTTGPPVHSHTRRLSPERLSVARKEFEHMMQLGIIRPSSSSWAGRLHSIWCLRGSQATGVHVGIIGH